MVMWTFQSTSPVRGTTGFGAPMLEANLISIHVPREGDDNHNGVSQHNIYISIHVPREGDDCNITKCTIRRNHFNPRPP